MPTTDILTAALASDADAIAVRGDAIRAGDVLRIGGDLLVARGERLPGGGYRVWRTRDAGAHPAGSAVEVLGPALPESHTTRS